MAGGADRPAEVHWQPRASRLFNLVLALLNEPPRSATCLTTNVRGYEGTPESRRRQFARDRDALAGAGVVVRAVPAPPGVRWGADPAASGGREGAPEELYTVDRDDVFLPDLHVTEGEADAIAAASRWAMSGPLAGAASRAYLKLAAAGVRRDSGRVVADVPDQMDFDEASTDAVFRALDNGLRISFLYWPTLLDEPVERTMDPWAIGAVDGRLYVTGHDIDRDAQRTFRLSRIAEVRALPTFSTHPAPPGTGRDLIEQGLRSSRVTVEAVLAFRGGGAVELRDVTRDPDPSDPTPDGASPGDEIRVTAPVDRTWLVRTAAAYAPDVVVLSPPDLRAEVVDLLRRAASAPEDRTAP
ncbi:helix-turn-helix transcriptional regulator [Corynebacterium bovis]|uniref:WYL domain-containing protein n=7 Tax=Corynebacterium bovis TaxID=36808 RepID=A0A426Q2Q7_9CORY|nr:WYL domain-containing protein [Corynebacterium bovis]RRO90837.1 WYL domain-containing protein [Corynebacterium bovis]RRQ02168.1 WYL domain-containing protein [Corynebacterium bovis]RRQ02412.1 WYL domain-containing protein [Corynebacterium bovis]RRQ06707.1 WYL domain-containing protein [Corynebacterium bovis]RRQ09922.1 WYL domain-containing protein [Corynebacterium bovis]